MSRSGSSNACRRQAVADGGEQGGQRVRGSAGEYRILLLVVGNGSDHQFAVLVEHGPHPGPQRLVAFGLAHRFEHQPGRHRIDRLAIGHLHLDQVDQPGDRGTCRELTDRHRAFEGEHRRVDEQFLLTAEVVADRTVRQAGPVGDRAGGHPSPPQLGDQLGRSAHQPLAGRPGRRTTLPDSRPALLST
jgi:hypothetical protein